VPGGPAAVGHAMVDSATGCTGNITTTPTNIIGCGGTCAVQTFTYDGGAVSGTPPPSIQAGSNCVSSGGETECAEQSKPGCGTFNGDEVCVPALASGSCQSYASGGVACVVPSGGVTSPPAPSSSSAPGTPATPTGQVQVVAADGTTKTADYYAASIVSGSASPVAGASGGANVGNGGSGSGSGSGASSAPAGDCSTNDCSGTVPTIPTVADVGTCT
jgi:hypothetical protein